MSAGAQSFSFNGAAASTSSAVSSISSPAPVTLGSGADTLALWLSEDAWQGDAQFTISVDCHQIGGTQTTTASRSAGQQQNFNLLRNVRAGTHSIAGDFLN